MIESSYSRGIMTGKLQLWNTINTRWKLKEKPITDNAWMRLKREIIRGEI